ncbi:putative DNA modification/repair radical SAM protein [Mesorhizobium sp. RMAD-H1]|uniref:putative DNA modification/repair radical SAM protein n=1 Tax=Mesorhizobium sp. RMAD-H1 TaxID=2587065 RepID=UPI0016145078|nr:putative DNA modification/repair radical SAM protein [Mesorhizobium sp. RMAD-H1]MBB2974344.1 putative DNA modification/repair radical SAM protein [Mesorhizobium sp. RMAD-H1]
MPLSVLQKLEILADAAKYDASCVSSGGEKRTAGKGIGSVTGQGICHAFTPDGRCVSLLKILLTNFCIYDCAYCVSRRSSNVRRARFSVDEVVRLTLDLYRRNCIEGLFLSSGIVRSADETTADLVRVAKILRLDHGFRGYVHLKMIPGTCAELLDEAGLYADRLSMNVEMPAEAALEQLAPEKSVTEIKRGLARTRSRIEESGEASSAGRAHPRRFAPAGQSTQMVVGADSSTDLDILRSSAQLYASYALERVYYSAFSPTGHPSAVLSTRPTPLIREHRLYQTDWLMRFYGFSLPEIEEALTGGMLDLSIDPKLAWALAHRDLFPVDINRASRELLLRVPGLGTKAVDRIIAARRHGNLRLAELARLAGSLKRVRPFVLAPDWQPGAMLDDDRLRQRLVPPQQLSLSL